MPRLRRTQVERSEQTQRQLIDAAIDLIMERGLAQATVQEICRRAEVTTGALQHHFGSKSELMANVIAALFVPFTREIVPLEHPLSVSLEARVERLVARYWKIYGDPRYYAVSEILLAIRHDPLLHRIVSEFRAGQFVTLSAFVPREFPDVALPPKRAAEIAYFALDLMRGFTVRLLFDHDDPALEREMLHKACRLILDEYEPFHDKDRQAHG
jgi:AcrR family transcriptional regulator